MRFPISPDDDEAPPATEPDPVIIAPLPDAPDLGPWEGRLQDDPPEEPLDLCLITSSASQNQDDRFILTVSSDETPKEVKQELVDQSITVPMTDVRSSTGATRQKWVEAAQKELDTLLTSKT
eukprot:144171-Amphidinium_carterae.1